MAGGDYGRIRHTFWTDPDIKRVLTTEQKALLLYFFTSPHSNLIGLYYCPLGYAAAEVGIPVEQVRAWTVGALSRFVTYDDASEEILVHRAAKHQVAEELKANDKRLLAVRKVLQEAHSPALVRRFLELYAAWPLGIEAPRTPPPDEGPSKPLKSPSEANAVAVQCSSSAPAMHPPGVAPAREIPEPADVSIEVPGDVGARVVPLRPATIEGLPFQNQDWNGRVSGSQVLAAWIALQPTPPSRSARDRYGSTCKLIADNHTTGEIALGFIGMGQLWPHAPPPIGKSQPWTPEHLWKRFAEAVPAAANDPGFKQAKQDKQFTEAFEKARRAGGAFG